MRRLRLFRRQSLILAAAVLTAITAGCSDDDGPKDLDRAALLDPQSCEGCHPRHYDEWSGSMHAYAGDDPVFLAMNQRGQEETNGELGDFCVKCHAPMAVREGATTDGLNLAEVPQHLKGVTCYFCHSVDAVEGTHNNPLRLSGDLQMRGAITDPVDNSAHLSGYAPWQDRDRRESAGLCGSCHDIVTPKGVHLERTYDEWQTSLFGSGPTTLTCANCHMPSSFAPAADADNVVVREIHDHSMPGVDVVMGPWPNRDAQLAAVQDELRSTVIAELCVIPPTDELTVQLTLENAFAGHNFPSGAAADRRTWVELKAYVGAQLVFESGVVGEQEPVSQLADPNLWLLRDSIFDDDGKVAHMFWDVATLESDLLPPSPAGQPNAPHFKRKFYGLPLDAGEPDRIEMRLLMRPMGWDIFEDLINSGHLLASDVSEMPTHTVTTLEWSFAEEGYGCVPGNVF